MPNNKKSYFKRIENMVIGGFKSQNNLKGGIKFKITNLELTMQ